MRKQIFLLFTIFSISNLVSQTIVAEYNFSGNANDNIGYSDGIVHNATLTQDRFGNVNSAYSFNGYNSYIEINNYIPFNFGLDDFSVAFWMKTTSTSTGTMFQKGSEYPNQVPQFWVRTNDNVNNNTLAFLTSNANPPSPYAASDTVTIIDGKWHHVIIQRSEKFLQLYVDCKLVATNYDVLRDLSDDIGVIIGAQHPHTASSTISNYFNGSLDDFKIYDDDLSYVQIMSICSDTTTSITQNSIILNNINLYPNPVSKELFIDGEYDFIEIFDIVGNKVFSSNYKRSINVENFEKAIYIIKLYKNDGTVLTKKITVN